LFSEWYEGDYHPINCPYFHRSKNIVITPEILDENGINYHTVLQGPGQLMVTFMEGQHLVINITKNMCEATNLGPPCWIYYGLTVAMSNKCIFQKDEKKAKCGARYSIADFTQVIKKLPEILIQKNVEIDMEYDEMMKEFAAMKDKFAQLLSITDDLQKRQPNLEVNIILILDIFYVLSNIFYLFLFNFQNQQGMVASSSSSSSQGCITGPEIHHIDPEEEFSSHHIRKVPTSKDPILCAICGKTVSNKSNLKTHEITHTGAKPFQCHECHKFFSKKSNLRTHQLTHTGNKAFECQECGKFFALKTNLKAHEKTHTDNKDFECHECQKFFTTKSSLRTHKKTHTNSKNFKCNECDKSFYQKAHLKTHTHTHLAKKKNFLT
jgi:hypothetical protein